MATELENSVIQGQVPAEGEPWCGYRISLEEKQTLEARTFGGLRAYLYLFTDDGEQYLRGEDWERTDDRRDRRVARGVSVSVELEPGTYYLVVVQPGGHEMGFGLTVELPNLPEPDAERIAEIQEVLDARYQEYLRQRRLQMAESVFARSEPLENGRAVIREPEIQNWIYRFYAIETTEDGTVRVEFSANLPVVLRIIDAEGNAINSTADYDAEEGYRCLFEGELPAGRYAVMVYITLRGPAVMPEVVEGELLVRGGGIDPPEAPNPSEREETDEEEDF